MLFRNKQVVEQLGKTGIDNIDLRTEIFPVEYAEVKRRSQELFEEHHPLLTIHCGMHSQARAVVLEQEARNSGKVQNKSSLINTTFFSSIRLLNKSNINIIKRSQSEKACTPYTLGTRNTVRTNLLCTLSYWIRTCLWRVSYLSVLINSSRLQRFSCLQRPVNLVT